MINLFTNHLKLVHQNSGLAQILDFVDLSLSSDRHEDFYISFSPKNKNKVEKYVKQLFGSRFEFDISDIISKLNPERVILFKKCLGFIVKNGIYNSTELFSVYKDYIFSGLDIYTLVKELFELSMLGKSQQTEFNRYLAAHSTGTNNYIKSDILNGKAIFDINFSWNKSVANRLDLIFEQNISYVSLNGIISKSIKDGKNRKKDLYDLLREMNETYRRLTISVLERIAEQEKTIHFKLICTIYAAALLATNVKISNQPFKKLVSEHFQQLLTKPLYSKILSIQTKNKIYQDDKYSQYQQLKRDILSTKQFYIPNVSHKLLGMPTKPQILKKLGMIESSKGWQDTEIVDKSSFTVGDMIIHKFNLLNEKNNTSNKIFLKEKQFFQTSLYLEIGGTSLNHLNRLAVLHDELKYFAASSSKPEWNLEDTLESIQESLIHISAFYRDLLKSTMDRNTKYTILYLYVSNALEYVRKLGEDDALEKFSNEELNFIGSVQIELLRICKEILNFITTNNFDVMEKNLYNNIANNIEQLEIEHTNSENVVRVEHISEKHSYIQFRCKIFDHIVIGSDQYRQDPNYFSMRKFLQELEPRKIYDDNTTIIRNIEFANKFIEQMFIIQSKFNEDLQKIDDPMINSQFSIMVENAMIKAMKLIEQLKPILASKNVLNIPYEQESKENIPQQPKIKKDKIFNK
jgi:hypothetical protein